MQRILWLSLIFFLYCGSVMGETVVLGVDSSLRFLISPSFLQKTIYSIDQALGSTHLEVNYLCQEEMRDRIERHQLDIFLSSSAFFRQQLKSGGKDLVTAQTERAADPNRGVGSAVLVRREDINLRQISDLKNKILGYSPEFGFPGITFLTAEIIEKGFPGHTFFSSIKAYPGKAKDLISALLRKEVDSIVLPTCILEQQSLKEILPTERLRLVSAQQNLELLCAHSTRLYPNITLVGLPTLSASFARNISLNLLNLEATDGMFWSVATDFSVLDDLLQRLNLDAYSEDRRWTLDKLWNKFWPLFIAAFFVIFSLGSCSAILSYLVRNRTKRLLVSLHEQHRLRQEANDLTSKLERLQRINALNHFSTVLSHELGQPLSNINCYTVSLSRLLERGNLNCKLFKTGLKNILIQSNKATEIVQRARNFIRSETSAFAPLSFSDIIHKSIESYRFSSNTKEDIIEHAEHEDIPFFGNAIEIELIIHNLLRNSAQAQKDLQSKAFTHVSYKIIDDKIELKIWDNGPAIKALPVVGLNASTKPDGLGLGLAIVEMIVNKHEGSMKFCYSKTGALLVIIELPLAKGEVHDQATYKNH